MKFNLQSVPSQGESEFSGQKAAKTRAWLNSARQFAAFFFQLGLLKDWPRIRKSRNGAGEMFGRLTCALTTGASIFHPRIPLWGSANPAHPFA